MSEMLLLGRFRNRRGSPQKDATIRSINPSIPELTAEEVAAQAEFLARIAASPRGDFMGAVTRTLAFYTDTAAPVVDIADKIVQKYNVEAPKKGKKGSRLSDQIQKLGTSLPHLFQAESGGIKLRHVQEVRSALARELQRKRQEEKPPERRDISF